MFGIFKLSGAPPMAFQYYRKSKDKGEKLILEDLNRAYSQYIKQAELDAKRMRRLAGSGSFDDPAYYKEFILSCAFDELKKYAEFRQYPKELSILFLHRSIF